MKKQLIGLAAKMIETNRSVITATALVPLLIISSPASYAASSELCNGILKKNGAFNLLISDATKSAREQTYEWLRTATWEEFKKRQDAGLKIFIPIDGVPFQADGNYTKDQFEKFTQLRDEGKLRNFSDDEFERTVSLTASLEISQKWLECMKINQDPRGMTCWGESDDRLENGVVVYKARYFTDSPLNTTEPTVRIQGGLTVVGGQVIQPNPLGPGAPIPFGGISVAIQRNQKSKITIALNSDTRGSCNTVSFPAIGNEPPPFKVQVFSQTSAITNHPQVTVGLPAGYKLIGGGAQVNWRGNGNLLVASYPNGNTWTAQSKDHMISDPSSITAWAIGLEDPNNQWEVKIQSAKVPTNDYVVGNVTVNLPPGFSRTGGGAMSEIGGEGRLLTSSYPNGVGGWSVTDKDHQKPQSGWLTAYVIGLKPLLGPPPDVVVRTGTGALAQHPTGRSSLDSGYILTGGGARTSCAQGNLLTGSYPLDPTTWMAEAKDHNVTCGSTIDVWAVGLKLPPGSFSLEGGGPAFQMITNFVGAMAIVPGALPALRPMPSGATASKSTYYISQQGDTFLSLALRFYSNTNWKKLSDANPEVTKSLAGPMIIPGTKILLPGI